MLQQTQVPRVVPKWFEFLERFPTPADCAGAPLGDVLRVWQGLGYPRRARNLHAAAEEIARRGQMPDTLEGLLSLPGVGPYTARAVLAFAFESDAAVVDTNVARVYARLHGRRLTAREVQASADDHLPLGDAWLWNQALMDLGAQVCRPVAPDCVACPVAAWCSWRGDATVDDPARGSAGVSTGQAPFAGSDRQARGRLLRALTVAPLPLADLPEIVGRAAPEAQRILDGVLADGLCVRDGDVVRLP